MIVVSPSRAIELASLGYVNNPFFAWDNLGAAATLGGSSVISGGERANAVTGSTYDKWRPAASGTTRTLTFDFGAPVSLSYASIAAHNVGTLNGGVAVQYSSDNTTWVGSGAGGVEPDDNSVIAWRFSAASFRYWRFLFYNLLTSDLLSVGVAFLGNELIMPRRFYQGFSPVITPTEVELQSNVSVGNELLGASVIGRGSTIVTAFQNIPPDFIRDASWLSFQRHFNDGGAAFMGWRPEKYPQDVHYIWREGAVIRPVNSGPRDLMAVNVEARVYNAQP